jgi:elongator complex protein 3
MRITWEVLFGKHRKINETAEHRVVGLTLETRPGSITPDEIREFRRLGCTRVEIGVQTLDDEITKKTKRIQTREQVVRGTRLLRQAGVQDLLPHHARATLFHSRKRYPDIS